MGDAYKGLTIKIGADTTSINSALKATEGALRQTQAMLNKLQKAFNLDPHNMSLAATYTKQLGTKASETYANLARMKDIYSRLGKENIGGTSLENFSAKIGDANLKAGILHDRFNKVTAELAATYNQLEKVTGVKLDVDHIASQESIARFKELGMAQNDIVKDSVYMARRLQEVFGKDLISDATIGHLQNLKNNFVDIQSNMENIDKAAKFQRMGKDLEVLNSSAHVAAREMISLNNASELSKSVGIQVVQQKLELVSNAAKEVDTRLEQVDNALQLDPKNVIATEQRTVLLAEKTNLAKERVNLLQQQLNVYSANGVEKAAQSVSDVSTNLSNARERAIETNQKLEQLRATLLEYKRQSDDLGKTTGVDKEGQEYRQLKLKIEQATREVSQYEQEAKKAQDAYDSAKQVSEWQKTKDAIADAQAQQKKAEQGAKVFGTGITYQMTDGFKNFGYGLSNIITQPLKRLATYSLDAATDVDSSFRNMTKTVDGTQSQFDELKEAAVEFSKTHITTAEQILEIEAMGGQLGISVDNLKDFAEVASSLDIATNIDAQTISQNMGQLVNIMDDLDVVAENGSGGVNNFADSLVRLGNNTPALESSIMDIATRISSQANILGMSTPDVLAWSAAIASTGQNSEAAGTAMAKTMSQIETAISQGGDKLKGFAEVSGMSAEDFAKTWQDSPTKALRAFIGGLENINSNGGSVEGTLQNLGITAVRQKQGLEGLTQTLGVLDDSLTMSNNAWNGVSDAWGDAGDAAREAGKKSEGFSGAVQILQNKARAAGEEIGEAFAPAIGGLSGLLSGVADGLSNMSAQGKLAVVSAGAVLAAIGPLTVGFGSLLDAIKTISEFKNTKIFSGLASALTSQWALVVAGAAVAIGAIGAYANSVKQAKEKQDNFNDALSNMKGGAKSISDNLASGAKQVTKYKEAANDAALSVEDLTKKIEDYNTKQQETSSPYQSQIDMLGQYKTVIDEMASKTSLTTEEQAKLDWALKGVNETLGTTFTSHDVLTGKYQTEQGEIKNTIDDLDKLIEKRQEEARIKATQELYTNAIKNQMELDKNKGNAERAYNSAKADFDQKNSTFDEWKTREIGSALHSNEYREAENALNSARDELNKTKEAWDAAGEAAKGAADDTKYYADMLGVSTAAASEHGQVLQTQLTSAFANIETKAKDANFSIADIAGACEQSGVSIQTLTDLGEQEFYDLLMQSGGNIQTLIDKLKELDRTKLHKKRLDVNSNLAYVEGFLNRINRMELAKKNLTISVSSTGDPVLGVGRVRAPQMRAKGGIIRKHADGAVFTSPTMIGARDMIGEAGAEYYDGTNIVPLTSRYSRPFARVIAEEFASLVGSGASTTNVTNNTYIDGARVNDNAGVQALFMRFMTELVRLGEMNRGVPNGAY